MSQSTDENKKRIKITTSNATFFIIMDDKTYRIYKSYDMVLTATRLIKALEDISRLCIINTGSIEHIDEFYSTQCPDCILCNKFHIDRFTYLSGTDIECHIRNIITFTIHPFIVKSNLLRNRLYCYRNEYKVYAPRAFSRDTITPAECFCNEDKVDLMMGFIYMQNAYGYDKVTQFKEHSIFGQAYLNAVKRVSEYEKRRIVKLHTPSFNDVLEELYKLLRKYKYYGYKLDESIEELYLSIESRLKENKNDVNGKQRK